MAMYLFYFISVLTFVDRSATITSCGDPGDITGGSKVYDTFDIGGVVTYSCDECYKLNGRKTIRCLSGRQWSHAPPSCVAVSCPSIKLRDQILPSRTFGGNHEFVCSFSYKMIGSSIITCQCNGTWSHEPPDCIPETEASVDKSNTSSVINTTTATATPFATKYCPFPDTIDNGTMYFIRETVGFVSDIFLPGATIEYSCNDGRHMIGQSSRVCQPNGEWATDAPICNQDAKFCVDPGAIKGGVYIGTNKVGDTLGIKCGEDYDIKGKRKVICERNGEYSDKLPTCIAKCGQIKCKGHEYCVYERKLRKAVCKCKSALRCTYNFKPVCASDARSYINECIMKVMTCSQGKVRRKVSEGYCQTGMSCQKVPRDNCRARNTVIYYNKEVRQCQKISGCTGRGFLGYLSEEECEKECKGLCSNKAEKGPCDLKQTRWTYNNQTNQCETFTYGGCFGTSNMFSSENDCEKFCVRMQIKV